MEPCAKPRSRARASRDTLAEQAKTVGKAKGTNQPGSRKVGGLRHNPPNAPPSLKEAGIDKRAMLTAMMYPEPEKGGRGKKALIIKEFTGGLLSQARTVLAHTLSAGARREPCALASPAGDGAGSAG